MEREKKIFLLEEWGKYCLDVSKLILAGVIIAGIMKEEIENYAILFSVGGIVFIIVLAVGFILLSKTKDIKDS